MSWSEPLLLSLRLAALTTLILLVVATPLAWWLAHGRSRLRPLVEVCTALPLVLPPTVLGFYLLLLLAPSGPIGGFWEGIGGARLVFSFPGLVIGSCVYSLPFAVQPLRDAFRSVGRAPLEAAAVLRASPLDRFLTVALPLAASGFVSAACFTFAHTLGEFGVVLMIGGSIPGATEVVSIAIYERVERLDYAGAHRLAAVILAVSALLLLTAQLARRRAERARP
jgi:molybdate transport system permease protein